MNEWELLRKDITSLEKKLDKTIKFTTNHIELQLLLNEQFGLVEQMMDYERAFKDVTLSIEANFKRIEKLEHDYQEHLGLDGVRVEVFRKELTELKEQIGGEQSIGKEGNAFLNDGVQCVLSITDSKPPYNFEKEFEEATKWEDEKDEKPLKYRDITVEECASNISCKECPAFPKEEKR